MLRGIDINPFKADLNLADIQFDFMLTKATGGNAYVSPDCDNKVQQAINLGKKWGVFHYFGDGYNDNDPISEANWFVDNCLGYIGKGILGLDWERGGNPNVNRVDMALAWLNHTRDRTGVKAVIYMSMAIYLALDWSPVIAAGYALWVAAWPENNNIIANYAIDPKSDPNPTWDGVVGDVLWQFTSTGRLDGYGGNLDCDLFYGDGNAWDNYARADTNLIVQAAPAEAPAPPAAQTTAAPVAPTTPSPATGDTTTTTTTLAPTPTGNDGDGTSTTETTTTNPADSQPPATAPVEASPVTTTAPPQQKTSWLTAIWFALIAIIERFQGKRNG